MAMRQSGTIALALVFAWLLVLAEARAERSSALVDGGDGGAADVQVDGWRAAAVRPAAAAVAACSSRLPTPHPDAPTAGIALRRCLRGVVLLI